MLARYSLSNSVNVCHISCLYLQDSVLRNCRPSMRPFKASKMRLLFLFLLGLMLFMAVMVIGYIIMNDDRLVHGWLDTAVLLLCKFVLLRRMKIFATAKEPA